MRATRRSKKLATATPAIKNDARYDGGLDDDNAEPESVKRYRQFLAGCYKLAAGLLARRMSMPTALCSPACTEPTLASWSPPYLHRFSCYVCLSIA